MVRVKIYSVICPTCSELFYELEEDLSLDNCPHCGGDVSKHTPDCERAMEAIVTIDHKTGQLFTAGVIV